MSSIADPARGRSIAWPIFALVIASVIVAALTIFAVTFNGPPPQLPVRDAATVARIMRTGTVPPSGDAPRLRFTRRADPPAADRQFHPDRVAADNLAAALGVPSGQVLAYTMRPPEDVHGSAFGRDFILAWRTGGGWRVVETPRPYLAPWHLNTLLAIVIATAVLAIPGWALARAISRPLAQVARAAEQAQAGATLPPLPSGGTREVRELAGAVAAMHERLAGHAASRTAMLGAIAHDLGTPLSRLAFWVEQLPDAARQRAAGDIDEMREMIAATLVFARDETGPLVTQRVDLGSLIDSLVEDMQVAGAPVAIEAGPRAIICGDSGALRRLFANLVENAIRYGDRAELAWRVAGDAVVVTIDDAGPGIDPAEAGHLFDPFIRGERSRNRATGGTGLGLAIVRSIATRHGGSVTLANAARGARATVTLPLA